MRAFLAIEIPGEVKKYLKTVIKNIAPYTDGVRWVKEQGQHITLKFFGEIGEDNAEKIREAVLPAAGKHRAFMVATGEISAFPDKRKARVIVVTLENGIDNIKDLFNDIEKNISLLGFEKEKRGFIPHITIGRRKMPAPLLEKAIIKLDRMEIPVNSVVLFKSTLTQEGAIYTPVWDIKLGG